MTFRRDTLRGRLKYDGNLCQIKWSPPPPYNHSSSKLVHSVRIATELSHLVQFTNTPCLWITPLLQPHYFLLSFFGFCGFTHWITHQTPVTLSGNFKYNKLKWRSSYQSLLYLKIERSLLCWEKKLCPILDLAMTNNLTRNNDG